MVFLVAHAEREKYVKFLLRENGSLIVISLLKMQTSTAEFLSFFVLEGDEKILCYKENQLYRNLRTL
jgi:hypothetical protein